MCGAVRVRKTDKNKKLSDALVGRMDPPPSACSLPFASMAKPPWDTDAGAGWAVKNKGPRLMAICRTITAFSFLCAGGLYVRGFMQYRLRSGYVRRSRVGRY